MARESFISKLGLYLGCLVGVIVIGITIAGWYQRKKPNDPVETVPSADRSPAGWETRYTATVALARRGSDLVKDRMEILSEMLDEDQQRRNFRTKLKDGRESTNELEAQQTVTNGLKALVELHRKRPDINLSSFQAALNKLAESSNVPLRDEALRTKLDLEPLTK